MIKKNFISIIIIGFILLISCKKETKSNGLVQSPTVSLGHLVATIYGKSVTFNISTVELFATTTMNSVVITGKSSDSSKTISLVFNNTSLLGEQEYQLAIIDTSKKSYISALYTVGNDSFKCDGSQSKGKINISVLTSSAIQGLFSFVATNIKDPTKKININGEFSTLYVTQVLADKGTIRANINNAAKLFNVISAFSVSTGASTSLIVEGRSTDNSNYLILAIKDVANIASSEYNCQTGTTTVTATLYASNPYGKYRCDGSSTTGGITLTSVSSSNVQGLFSFTGTDVSGNSTGTIAVTGEFNSDLKSSTSATSGNMIAYINGQQSLMTISKAVNYMSPNRQSVQIDGVNNNMDSVSFLLQRITPLTNDVFEFGIFNDAMSSYILANYYINGQPFPMLSNVGQAVFFNISNQSISGAFSFDCTDNSDTTKIYTVNSEFNTNLTTYNLASDSTFIVNSDSLTAHAVKGSTAFVISGSNSSGKTIASISFTNVDMQESVYQCGSQNLQATSTVTLTYWVGSTKYVCDGVKISGEVRIESYTSTNISGFYSVIVYNLSNLNDKINLTGSFNSPFK